MKSDCWRETVISPAGMDDREKLFRLEKLSFANPWSQDLLACELAHPLGVAFLIRQPAGPAAAWLCARIIAPEAELLRIAVAPEWRRQGLAGRLLARLESELGVRRVESLYLEVAETNRAALAFYRSHDFSPAGRRPGYYDSGRTAALVLKKSYSRV